MKCKEARQLISPYLDGILEGKEKMALQQHLDHCSLCRDHYRDTAQLSSMLRAMGKDIKPAPVGFKDAVMLAVQQDSTASVKPRIGSGWMRKTWKKTVPAAAAAVLFLFASLNSLISGNPGLVPIALQQPEQSDPAPPMITDINTDIIVQPGQMVAPQTVPDKPNPTQPDVPRTVADNPPDSTETLQTPSTPVLLSVENRNILSTMLIIRNQGDQSTVFEQVQAIAAPYGATAEKLGQQVKDGASYNLFKLVVDRGQGASLISRLSSLGTVVSRSDDRQDISQAYTRALEQFLSLSTQRGETQDPAKLKQLDKQIAELQQQLGDWKQKAGSVTVVLWIQD